jgi:branched-chain amino acid transport system permease protein
MIFTLLYITLAQAWNIIGGYAGQVNLAFAVYFGIGGYTSSLLFLHADITPWLGMLIGGLVAATIAWILSFPLLRLRGPYFAIGTLALGFAALVAAGKTTLIGGSIGLWLPIHSPSLYYMEWSDKTPYYYMILTITVLTIALVYRINRSKLGTYLQAIKQDEDVAQSLGIEVPQYKTFAMVISSFIAAIGGTFFTQYLMYINHQTVLDPLITIKAIIITVLGGLGTVTGPILGGLILTPLSEYARAFLAGYGQAFDYIVYGFIILIISVYNVKGLVFTINKMLRAAKSRWKLI